MWKPHIIIERRQSKTCGKGGKGGKGGEKVINPHIIRPCTYICMYRTSHENKQRSSFSIFCFFFVKGLCYHTANTEKKRETEKKKLMSCVKRRRKLRHEYSANAKEWERERGGEGKNETEKWQSVNRTIKRRKQNKKTNTRKAKTHTEGSSLSCTHYRHLVGFLSTF